MKKDRGSYILSYFLVKEPVNAEAEDSLVVHFVKPAQRLSLCFGPKDQVVIFRSFSKFCHSTNHCR